MTVAPTPGRKLGFAILIGLLLAVPLLAVYALVYDRQAQSEVARQSITQGWGGPQTIAGPILAIPYQTQTTETVTEGNRQVTRTSTVWRELRLAPQRVRLDTEIKPERRKRSIYEAVIFEARTDGEAQFVLPVELARSGIDVATLAFDRAELRFGLSDVRGLVAQQAMANGQPLTLQPGNGPGATSGKGFFAWLDAGALRTGGLTSRFSLSFRGNSSLTLSPRAGETDWRIWSPWTDPSFAGGFLPISRRVDANGFEARYRIGNLALGQSLIDAGETEARASSAVVDVPSPVAVDVAGYEVGGGVNPSVALIQPVDLYDQATRATKYGFLFIGFTFLALLMFDVIGGARVSTVEYLLVGAGLVLFFVLLLAFAEVIGFLPAYLLASAAIVGLVTAYSASVLRSWRRAGYLGGMLVGLYAVLYILLSLEAYSLLIGALLLFAALAAVMYATRNVDWSARTKPAVE